MAKRPIDILMTRTAEAIGPPADPPAPGPVPAGPVRITATVHGFRRAGRAWPGSPGTIVAPDELTADQWAAVRAEPRLVVAAVT